MTPSSKTIKYSKVKKKKQTFTIKAKSSIDVAVSYTSSKPKYVTVNEKGKVTVKKKAPKGTYKITVEVFEDFDYDETTKIRTVYKVVKKAIKIKVK